MKNERITLELTFGSILLQWYFMYSSDVFEMTLPFSTGLLSADTMGGNLTQIMFSIIPIPFLLWLFSGRMELITKGYGKVYIIRNYGRGKMLFKEVGKMILSITLIECFAWAAFQGLSNSDWISLSITEQLKVMTLYTQSLIGAVLLQYCLELMMNQAYAQIVTLVYYTVSLFTYNFVHDTSILNVIKVVFFPNLGFAMRNGAIEAGNPALFVCSMIEILLICTFLIFISLKIVNQKDIM